MDAGIALSKLRAFVSWHAESRDGEGTALLMIADVEHELVTLREAVKAANDAAAKRTPEIAAERDAVLAAIHAETVTALREAREILVVLERDIIGDLDTLTEDGKFPEWAKAVLRSDASSPGPLTEAAANRANAWLKRWAGQVPQ